ncbi:MAG: hypothetical protein IKS11_01425 [Lachnospiraceae bacterium]|nr:hypothetical protein [Lachnospiraceae bacterium]
MKTKLGISAGAFAALTFLMAIYGGYTVILLAIGYVLIAERNEWLRTTVVKAGVIMLFFSIVSTLLYAIPDLLGWINSFLNIFDKRFNYSVVTNIVRFLDDTLVIIRRVLFLLLALFALGMKTIKIGFVDKFVAKHLQFGEDK